MTGWVNINFNHRYIFEIVSENLLFSYNQPLTWFQGPHAGNCVDQQMKCVDAWFCFRSASRWHVCNHDNESSPLPRLSINVCRKTLLNARLHVDTWAHQTRRREQQQEKSATDCFSSAEVLQQHRNGSQLIKHIHYRGLCLFIVPTAMWGNCEKLT